MTKKPKPKRAEKHAAKRGAKPVRKGSKAAKPAPLDEFIAAGARSLVLKIGKAWLPAVRTHLQITLEHGAKVAAFALPDDSEPAPVFEA